VVHRRRSSARVALLVGACLLVGSLMAGAAAAGTAGQAKKGGTFVVELSTDIDYIDPQLDYLSSGWEIQYAVGCKLFNYPDKMGDAGSQLQPEAALGPPTVTKDGKTYVFRIRPGLRFSTGEAVTAKSFADTINRIASQELQSPGSSFIDIIQGADAALAGRSKTVSGVNARGNVLTIKLLRPAPDLIARLAMPFFQAINPALAATTDPQGVNTFASCGPYYVAARTPGRSITLKRNPYYKGTRPHNVDQIEYRIGNSLQVIEQNVESGNADFAAQGLDPTSWKRLADKYGVNKGRVYIAPSLSVAYLAMNQDRPLFKNNLPLRQAVNFAIDRRALLSQAGFGAGIRSDHILPPGVPGAQKVNGTLYPLKAPNLKKANALAKGHTGDGKAVLWTSNRGAAPLQAQIYQYNLKQIGLDVEVQQYSRAVQITREGVRGAPFDFTTEQWTADYPDPYDFMNVLLSGDSLRDANNNNIAYFNDPKYNQAMRNAAKLTGASRYSTYGGLDMDISKNAVPWAVRAWGTDRIFVSARTGCFVHSNVYSFDLAAVCIK
jgi:peptide/nickel transport system substrate-binding protein